LKALAGLAREKRLSPVDRWGIENDLYALVQNGRVPLDTYLAILLEYGDEDAFLPLMSIAENLSHLSLILEGEKHDRVVEIGRSLMERVLGRIGYEPDSAEKPMTSTLRDAILWVAVRFGSKESENFARNRFVALTKGQTIHPDIMKSVMQVGALHGDESIFSWFQRRLETSDSEHERMNILIALGKFRERRLIEKAQQFILEKVPSRNKFVAIGSMASNAYAIPLLWGWFRSQTNRFEQFHPLHYERVLGSIIPYGGLGQEEEVMRFFERYLKTTDKARDTIKLSLERLEIHRRMRSRAER
jgi:hypothetical protein